jgi:prolyl-tRNA synthetase
VGARGLKEGVVELRERRSKELIKLAPDALVDAATAARDRLA